MSSLSIRLETEYFLGEQAIQIALMFSILSSPFSVLSIFLFRTPLKVCSSYGQQVVSTVCMNMFWSHKNCSVLLLLFETGGQAYFSYFFLNNKLVILSITAKVHGQDKKTFMHLERTYSANTRITVQYSVCYVPLITVELWFLAVLGCLSGIFVVFTI